MKDNIQKIPKGDIQTVTTDTINEGWMIVSFQLLENYIAGNFAGESSVQSLEVNCKTKQRSMVRTDYYSRHFGRGGNIDFLTEDWVYPAKGLVNDLLDRGVCGYLRTLRTLLPKCAERLDWH